MPVNLEQRFALNWEELDGRATAATIAQPLLIIHDEDDHDVPATDGAANATLALTQGLGHRGIMRDAGIVARSVAFLEAHVPR
jgi:pimeloyl-ACP methyl ester carboxylesterase